MPATVAPTPRRGFGWQVRIALLEARFQFLSSFRLPAFAVPTLLFPLFFYLFFGVLFQRGGVSLAAPTYMLATFGVFGIFGPSIFGFGVGLAQERDSGALLLKRTTPMPAVAYLFARVAVAVIFGAVVLLGLFLLGAYAAGVELHRWQWFSLAGTILAGVLPLCALGLAIGAWAKQQAAVAVVNLVFISMSVLSGLWFPINMLPGFLQDFAIVLPAYHLGQLALKVINLDLGQPAALHVGLLAGQTAVFLAVAAAGLRRFSGR